MGDNANSMDKEEEVAHCSGEVGGDVVSCPFSLSLSLDPQVMAQVCSHVERNGQRLVVLFCAGTGLYGKVALSFHQGSVYYHASGCWNDEASISMEQKQQEKIPVSFTVSENLVELYIDQTHFVLPLSPH